MAEKGEPLNGENLTALYLKLVREYYGHDQGVCEVKDAYGVEWAYIPHFYYDFYVYQYATSVIAAVEARRRHPRRGRAKPRRRRSATPTSKMLSSGSSRYAYDMLKDAGVDMTTSAPFDAAMRDMNRTMDAMESILDKRGGKTK